MINPLTLQPSFIATCMYVLPLANATTAIKIHTVLQDLSSIPANTSHIYGCPADVQVITPMQENAAVINGILNKFVVDIYIYAHERLK